MAGVDTIVIGPDGTDLDSWAAIAAGPVPDFQTRLVARRGWYPSGIPLQRNTFAVEAADTLVVVAAAAAQTGQRVHLLGGSYGALVALFAAAATPSLVAATLWEFLSTVVDRH